MMFQPIASFCLAIVYFLLSLGGIAQLHYCGSNLSGIGFYEKDAPVCSCAELSKSDCCHDATVNFAFDTQTTITAQVETPIVHAILTQIVTRIPSALFGIGKFALQANRWHPPQKLRQSFLATWRI
jgi:hypothetical protein